MGDLVFLLELSRTPGAPCASLKIDHVSTLRRAASGSIIAMASPPCSPVAIVLTLNPIGAKSINACTSAGKPLERFDKWYDKRLNLLLRLDVGPEKFYRFRWG